MGVQQGTVLEMSQGLSPDIQIPITAKPPKSYLYRKHISPDQFQKTEV